MSLESDYKEFARYHAKYEIIALKLLLKEFRDLFANIKFDNLSFDETISQAVIELNINQESLSKVIFKLHYTIGLDYGRMIARQIRKENPIELKSFKPLPFFDEEFQEYILENLRIYGGRKIRELSKTAAKTVIIEIRKGVKAGETLEEMRDRVMKRVKKKDFYAWQAMRIVRTEVTNAMNSAKEIANITSGVEMDKIWLTRMDGKERRTHAKANKQKVTQSGFFEVGGYKMKFPGDTSNGAPARETVNCRCTYSFQAKRDENGRLQFNDDAEIEAMLREMKGK